MKNYNKTCLILASFLFFLSSQSNIHAATMTDIGAPGVESYPYAVSADGSTIVGVNYNGTNDRAFKYSNGVTTDLGTLGGLSSTATGLSYDGSTIVGYAEVGSANYRAFKYTDSGGMFDIGTLGGNRSFANDISADGSIIVGSSMDASLNFRAFKYTVTGPTSGTMVDIGLLAGGGTSVVANAISADGLVTVGYSDVSAGIIHAFRHTDADGMVDLGTLGGTNSMASKASADGSIIVGQSHNSSGNYHAFKYVTTGTTTGTISDLGTLGGLTSYANGISADGSIIVGGADNASGNQHAFKYTSADGMIDLGTLGGLSSTAYSISANGQVIVGTSETTLGVFHAFIYQQNNIVDINNTYSALSQNGAQLNSLINLKTALTNFALNQDCDQFGKSGLCVGVGGRYSGVDKHNSSEEAANLRVAYKITPRIKAGFMIDQAFNSSDPENFSVHNSLPMASVFANISENNDGSGFNFRVAGAYNKAKTNIKRSVLSYTEAGSGDADLKSTGVLAQLSYKKSLSKSLELTPYLGVRQTNVTRDGYTETSGASFPITYDSLTSKSTTAILGLSSSMKLTSNLGLEIGAGVEHDLSNKTDGYSGTIPYLGSFAFEKSKMTDNRAFTNVGSSYQITDNQKISTGVYYGKQALSNANATAVYVNYSIGL